jgi:hypothetical protein
MKKFAIVGALRPPRTDVMAIICGTLCSVAAALPAKSADLYPYYENTGYWPSYSGYYHGCGSCGCHQCGHRPFVEPGPVVERHWDYWERRYPAPYPYRYPYGGGYAGYPYSPPSNYGGYPYSRYPNDYPAYSGGARPHLGFGGVQYPPAPVSYQYQTPPAPYEYQAPAPYEYQAPAPYAYRAGTPAAYDYPAAARPGYDYELAPRPPVGIPGAYSNASYVE